MANTKKEDTGLGGFKSQEELLAAFESLKAEHEAARADLENLKVQHETAVDSFEAAKAKFIKDFEAQQRKSLGTPNVMPGVKREPRKSQLPNGTVRVDY